MANVVRFIVEVVYDLEERDWDDERKQKFAASDIQQRLTHPLIQLEFLAGYADSAEHFAGIRKAAYKP